MRVCLGIPARIVALGGERPGALQVDISGSRRSIDGSLLVDEPLVPGDWVVVHMGFALERITEQEAAEGLEILDPGAT